MFPHPNLIPSLRGILPTFLRRPVVGKLANIIIPRVRYLVVKKTLNISLKWEKLTFMFSHFREKSPPYALDYTNPINNINYETINNLKNKEILINNENAHLLLLAKLAATEMSKAVLRCL